MIIIVFKNQLIAYYKELIVVTGSKLGQTIFFEHFRN